MSATLCIFINVELFNGTPLNLFYTLYQRNNVRQRSTKTPLPPLSVILPEPRSGKRGVSLPIQASVQEIAGNKAFKRI